MMSYIILTRVIHSKAINRRDLDQGIIIHLAHSRKWRSKAARRSRGSELEMTKMIVSFQQ